MSILQVYIREQIKPNDLETEIESMLRLHVLDAEVLKATEKVFYRYY